MNLINGLTSVSGFSTFKDDLDDGVIPNSAAKALMFFMAEFCEMLNKTESQIKPQHAILRRSYNVHTEIHYTEI